MRLLAERLPKDQAIRFAADCAERVLPIFETVYPADVRPRKAIEVARSGASVAVACAATGHAAATIHVATHAAAAADYAARAASNAGENSRHVRRLRLIVARADQNRSGIGRSKPAT